MVVLTAICAALYAAILIPFKVVPLIPGITELRPANAVPVVCSFLFGPAAAWGAAFGNLIGDFFGGLGPGDLFGFVANLLYGLVPYAVWQAVSRAEPVPRGPLTWIGLLAVIALAATLCATVVGWGLQALGFHPRRRDGPRAVPPARPLPPHPARAPSLPRPPRTAAAAAALASRARGRAGGGGDGSRLRRRRAHRERALARAVGGAPDGDRRLRNRGRARPVPRHRGVRPRAPVRASRCGRRR
jgi:uncharacterized membrane protein